MANQEGEPSPGEFIGPRVRQNALGAGIAAALMLYFGFGGGEWTYPPEPLGRAGGLVIIYTIKIGGVMMLVSALGSVAGFVHALLFDAACSILIGSCLILGSLLMALGGSVGLTTVLCLVFGVLFISGGIRNGREWKQLTRNGGPRQAYGRHPGNGDDDA